MKRMFVLVLVLSSCSSTQKIKTTNKDRVIDSVKIVNVQRQPSCSEEMVFVAGKYCTNVIQPCITYKDPPGSIVRRCSRFAQSQCVSTEKTQMSFCIDRDEYSTDNKLPLVSINWFEAKEICESSGKRLCTDTEWTFACEGEDQLPYPYGYVRDSSICNIDEMKLVDNGKFIDHRSLVTDYPKCLSSFGVHNMTGNVDEWVVNLSGSTTQVPYISGLKGGWWGPVRNRCRPMTAGHNQGYKQEQIGFRCCKDLTRKDNGF